MSKEELGLARENEELWLVKVPQHICDRWAQCKAGDDVGSLTLLEPSSSAPKLCVELPPRDHITPEGGAIKRPSESWKLMDVPLGRQMVPLVFDDEKNKFDVIGRVSKRLMMAPADPSNLMYRSLTKSRTIQAGKVRTGTVTSAQLALSAHRPTMGIDFIPPVRPEDRKAEEEERLLAKRMKTSGVAFLSDKNALQHKIFAKFDKSDHYTLKDLANQCDSSEKEVKDILHNYAFFHKSGPFKNYWELKAEFQASAKKT
jgi:hypothetical protein